MALKSPLGPAAPTSPKNNIQGEGQKMQSSSKSITEISTATLIKDWMAGARLCCVSSGHGGTGRKFD